jgi:hypothetical protein
VTLSWKIGMKGEPQNPSCQKARVIREFIWVSVLLGVFRYLRRVLSWNWKHCWSKKWGWLHK